MEFKITHETTLYELQEHCKKNKCKTCELCESYDTCRYTEFAPDDWDILKPKTYKEDFLEKFPNTVTRGYNTPLVCKSLIYDGAEHCINQELNCDKCWNEIMEDDINAE